MIMTSKYQFSFEHPKYNVMARVFARVSMMQTCSELTPEWGWRGGKWALFPGVGGAGNDFF